MTRTGLGEPAELPSRPFSTEVRSATSVASCGICAERVNTVFPGKLCRAAE